ALVPLATPLVAGPGAIATSIVLWRAHPGVEGHVAVIAAIVLAVAVVGVALLVAERVTRATSPAVLQFLTRVFGLLLSAIAVRPDGRHLCRVLHPAPVRGARAERDLHAVGLDRPDHVLDATALPGRPRDARREARQGRQGGVRRAERDRAALRRDRRPRAGR